MSSSSSAVTPFPDEPSRFGRRWFGPTQSFWGVLFALPMLGAQFGIDLSIVSHVIAIATGAIIDVIVHFTGNA